ncbi:hypothetical protein BIW11_09116, partial [Tropilaelaps mercedesae]
VITVTSPRWGEIGSVHHEWSLSSPQLAIKNSEGKTQLRIVGPICTCDECQKDDFIIFPVTSEESGEQVGRIIRPFPRPPESPAGASPRGHNNAPDHLMEDPTRSHNSVRQPSSRTSEPKPEANTLTEGYSVSFNKELPVSMKAVLLASVFLIVCVKSLRRIYI